MSLLRACASIGVLCAATTAFAQPKKDPEPKKDPPKEEGGTAVELEDDTPSADPSGTAENPGAPTSPNTDAPIDAPPPPPPMKKSGYPIEEVQRPITLPTFMSEVALDMRTGVAPPNSPVDAEPTLRGRFGITRQWQIGLEYGIGGFYDDNATDMMDKVEFNTGKSLGFDVTYQALSWVGARVAVPMYLDPFAIGATFGAPLKFRLGPKFAFGGMHDFLSIKFHNFMPSTTSERENEANAGLVATNTGTAAGALRFSTFGVYQAKPNLALGGQLGITLADFSSQDSIYTLRGTLQHSPMKKLDLGAALGFGDLTDARNSFQVNLFAQFRI
jgi:hypothetical protein